MTVLFALFKYFPWGGLQNDALRFAKEMLARNHRVVVFTTAWTGAAPEQGLEVEIVKVSGFSNHAKMRSFARKFQERLKRGDIDASIAMNRIPGADFYFAADSCMAKAFKEKHGAFVLRFHPRYRSFLADERAIFQPGSKTRIFSIAQRQIRDFRSVYGTEEERFLPLPPGMNPNCGIPPEAEAVRKTKRRELGVQDGETLAILVGTNFQRKGMDRALLAVKNLRAKGIRFRFVIVGNDSFDVMNKRIQEFGLSGAVLFLGPRRDVPELLLAADLMIHPAREEAAGSVLIEALASGIPVVCTERCGFSPYVEKACGLVLADPFSQEKLENAIERILAHLPELKKQVRDYAAKQDFQSRTRVFAEAVEAFGTDAPHAKRS